MLLAIDEAGEGADEQMPCVLGHPRLRFFAGIEHLLVVLNALLIPIRVGMPFDIRGWPKASTGSVRVAAVGVVLPGQR